MTRHEPLEDRRQVMLRLSKHAEKRFRQRGAKPGFIELVLNYADIEVPVGSNCRSLRVSRRTAHRLNLDDRIHLYAVIVSDDTGEIVTMLPTDRGRRGARYRRRWKGRGWRGARYRRRRR